MKKLLFVVFAFAWISANAQTADEIIQKYTAAMGGLDAFNKTQTIKMSGTVTAQGMSMPITIQIVNGKAMRTDVDVMGKSITNVYNNGKGWKINPYAGAPEATEVTGPELIEFKSQSMMASQLMDYKARGNQVELDGQEDVEGVKTFKLKLTGKDDGKVTTYFISATDFTPVKIAGKKEMQGQEMELETYFSDLKEFNGLKISTTRTQKVEGQVLQELKFDKVELNVPIDEKIFNMP
jgi:hypothetical protein